MKFIKSYGLLILVIIIAGFFRLYNLSSVPPGLYPDEAMNGNNALEAISTNNYKVFYPENNGREGLFINIQALFLIIFNQNEPWVLRSASAVFGILTVIGVYLLVYEYIKKHPYAKLTAFLASFFVATSFWHINFSRIGFRAIMAPALMALALYFLIKTFNLIREKKDHKSILPYFIAAIGGIIYGLGMHSYIAYRATPIIILLAFALEWFFYKTNFKTLLKVFVIYVGLSILVFAPLGIFFLKHPEDFMGRTSQLSIFESPTPLKDFAVNTAKTIGMFFYKGDSNWRHNLSGAPQVFWLVAIFLIIGTIVGLSKILHKKIDHGYEDEDSLWLICIIWIAVSALPVVISNEGLPHALRSILMIPPVYIISAIGAVYAFNFCKEKCNKKVLYSFSILVLAFLAVTTYVQYFITWANNPETQGAFAKQFVELGRQINNLPQSLTKFIIVNAGGVDVRGLPMPTQTTMFITDTFTKDKQQKMNVFYIPEGMANRVQNLSNSIVFYLEPK